jgi:large subunit ribosomal protein L30
MVYELQVTNCQLQMFKRGSEMTTKTAKSVASGKIQLKWVRSMICTPVKHKKVVKGLGFTRLNQVIVRPDTAAIRGMVKKIPHLVEIVK